LIHFCYMIYTHTTNQIASLQNQATCMQETKQNNMHLLSLVQVSQAHGYGPGYTDASN
jgi:conjugal transfer/entry exclusion protein